MKSCINTQHPLLIRLNFHSRPGRHESRCGEKHHRRRAGCRPARDSQEPHAPAADGLLFLAHFHTKLLKKWASIVVGDRPSDHSVNAIMRCAVRHQIVSLAERYTIVRGVKSGFGSAFDGRL